jgi:hypothetical protein
MVIGWSNEGTATSNLVVISGEAHLDEDDDDDEEEETTPSDNDKEQDD